jgi:thioredoxin reductase
MLTALLPAAGAISRPAMFAVGDMRSGSVKRVAAAIGEGSMAVRFAGHGVDPGTMLPGATSTTS